jgi:hypothetical protein
VEQLEIEEAGSASVSSSGAEKCEIDGGGSSVRPVLIGLERGKVRRFGRSRADVASVVAGYRAVTDVEVDSDSRRQRDTMAGSRREIPVISSGCFVGVNVELGVEGQVVVGDMIILVAENMFDGRKRGKLFQDVVERLNEVPVGCKSGRRKGVGVLETL